MAESDTQVEERGERKRLVAADAAARLLDVPKTWVLAEARANRIPHVRLGRYVRFEPHELELWWEARRRGPQLGRGPVL
jgi:excisionase family DNA binding protein